jgi:hypothetical protein
MSGYDKGGYLDGGKVEVTAHKPEAVLTEAMWADIVAKAKPAIDWVLEQMRRDPKQRRAMRKGMARERKRQAIEARQVARAVRGIEWAPPLLRNGKAPR